MRCLVVTCLLLTLAPGLAAADKRKARPRYFLRLLSVNEPAKLKPSLKQGARQELLKALGRYGEVTTDLGQQPKDAAALARLLKARKLAGYELGFRITRATHSMNPPAPGKVYKVLMVELGVAIDMQKIPTDQMAVAGEGTAQVGVETKRFNKKERDELLREALAEATKQAVHRTIQKLNNPPAARDKPSPRKKRRRKKKRRR